MELKSDQYSEHLALYWNTLYCVELVQYTLIEHSECTKIIICINKIIAHIIKALIDFMVILLILELKTSMIKCITGRSFGKF